MKPWLKSVIRWTPRVLALLFAIFLSLFALDVFGEGYSAWETVLALLIHLIPTYLVLIALALGWWRAWTGALAFAGLSVWYIIMAWGDVDPLAFLLIAGPPLLIAILFLITWLTRDVETEPAEAKQHAAA